MDWLPVVLLSAALAPPTAPSLHELASFQPGPHDVGVRAIHLVDAARPWPSASDPSGSRGRPIAIAFWYPAERSAADPATVADLIVADAIPGGEPPSSEARAADLARARPFFERGLDRPLAPGEWQRVLDTPTRAALGAAALPGRRALLLLEGGLGARSYFLAQVAELLASYGYVVAALATAGASETDRLGFDLGGIRAQVDDMKLTLARLADRPEVDSTRVGLVGWSTGGVSQALLRLERPDAFRAAVSLDSGSGYAYGAALLQEAGGVDPARLRTPFLHFDVGVADADVPKDDSFLRAHAPGGARRVRLEDLRHADFTLPYGATRALATAAPTPRGMRRLGVGLVAFLADRLPPGFATERVELSSDGWTLVGDLARPDRLDAAPAALLLNKAAGSRDVYRGLAEELARRGIASLRLDLRAHGESTNRGRFVPPEGLPLLQGSERDVRTALEQLRRDPTVDGSRLAVVGASYSGESMMEAGRQHGFEAAYVGLSPGSLSDESIAAIDRGRMAWLLVVARHERHLKEVEQAFREQSRDGELWELPGTRHATDLLAAHPSLARQLAVWLEFSLTRAAAAE